MVEAITQNVNTANMLDMRFAQIKDKQGILGNIWNGVKEITGSGISKSKCESVLEQYKQGYISFDEALEYIESFDRKQNNMTDLESNIATGIGAIAVATCLASGPMGWIAALTFGAPVGAVLKPLIKIFDRATNKVKNDELNAKQIMKDTISGAMVGATSAVSSGVGAGIRAGSFKLAVSNGGKCGAQCGALAGATSYMTDVAFENDRKFNLEELIETTMSSAFIAGTVGAVVGTGMYKTSKTVGQDVSKSLKNTIIEDSTTSSSRKVLGKVERSIFEVK